MAFVVAITADEPQPQVERYLRATASGDEKSALDAWSPFASAYGQRAALAERRVTLTAELAARRVGANFVVTSVEWWRTCCEPGRIDDSRNAGLARFHITTRDAAGVEYRLVFDVWAKEMTYWGDAAGSPRHDWTLYEVHREGEPCLLGAIAMGCAGPAG